MSKNTDEELNKLYKEIKSQKLAESESAPRKRSSGSSGSESGDLMQFFIGLIMLAGGLYMVLQNINVTSSWGFFSYRIGFFQVSSGMVLLPSIIGILMLFMMEKRIFGWIVLSIGIAIILLSVFLTTHIYWKTTSAYNFIIMFGFVAAGAGLVIKQLFKQR